METRASFGETLVINDFVADGEDQSICSVCGARSNGFHFGVPACRACAVFFRRCVAFSKKYHCTNQGNCPIHKDSRNMCRSCRFRKCERVGMHRSCRWSGAGRKPFADVQLYRDKIRAASPWAAGARPPPPPPRPSAAAYSLLTGIGSGYEEFLCGQRALYSVLYPEHMFCEEIQWKEVDMMEFVQFERASLPLIFQMLNNHFAPFAAFSKLEKKIVMDWFSYLFCRLSQCFQTVQNFPDMDDPRIFLNFGQFMRNDHAHHFYRKDKDPEGSRVLSAKIQKRFEYLTKKFRQFDVKFTECAALIGMLFWREVAAKLNKEIGMEMQLQITRELFQFHLDVYGGPNVVRFGHLTLLLRDIEELYMSIKEGVYTSSLINDHYRLAFDDIVTPTQ